MSTESASTSKMIDCQNIYGLFSNDKEDVDNECPILHAISINKETIKNILQTCVDPSYFEYANFEIKIVKMHLVSTLLIRFDSELTKKKHSIFYGESNNIFIGKSLTCNEDIMTGKLYCCNLRTITGGYEQAILNFVHNSKSDSVDYKEYIENIRKEKMFSGGLSENSIEFDTYYDEGLMNV
jgi:hypothetical protein